MAKNPLLYTKVGSPLPFGASFQGDGVNFSVYSKNATAVTLAFFNPNESEPFAKIALDPQINRRGDVWHIFVSPIQEGIHYGYYVDGPHDPARGFVFDATKLLIDPNAVLLSNSTKWGEPDPYVRAILVKPLSFDWEDDRPPNHSLENMVIYEMHVRGFTKHPSSTTQHPGTFLGVIDKIKYLKSLGINAIETLPVHSFNECEYLRQNPVTNENLYNYWGYSTFNFFAPMNRYGSDNANILNEFRQMVKALHKEGIEVILDVVFNHTSEGNEKGPTLSFRGFENSIYYMLSPNGDYYNFSGCGNTLNCNHPVVRELIRNSLRYWVSEMHVDGFRFDLASILGRSATGEPLSSPPLLEMIALDPILGKIKLIAEAWDAGGLYQVGSFPSWGVWAEWNGKYRDNIRKFIKGDENCVGYFATRICGSPDLYASSRTPGHSVNFITCHDGFSLKDLVSYNEKHNLENGEDGRDGTNENESWNCGIEGPTDDEAIITLRNRQMRNFMVALFVSQGLPMLCMGDEAAHTKRGNNNTWCHDNDLNWFVWDKIDQNFLSFVSQLIHFRHKHTLLKQKDFLSSDEIQWHGAQCGNPDWSPQSRFLGFTLFDKFTFNDLYIAFNTNFEEVIVELPTPRKNKEWYLICDTKLPCPDNFSSEETSKPIKELNYLMAPYSSIILKTI